MKGLILKFRENNAHNINNQNCNSNVVSATMNKRVNDYLKVSELSVTAEPGVTAKSAK